MEKNDLHCFSVMSVSCVRKTVTFKCVGKEVLTKLPSESKFNVDHDNSYMECTNDWAISAPLHHQISSAPTKQRVLYGRRVEADHAPELGQDYTDM